MYIITLEILAKEERENDSEVNKLAKCNFSGIRRSLREKFLPGTRQWLFDELSTWFSDEHSNSNVMILTAGPGVGKSVFAAEVCNIYAEHGKLAACHFCQYNKSRDYSDPRKIIESLASSMCDNIAGFKIKLDDQLQRSHSRETLSDAFRVLLNDPLHALGEREPMLLVIDALDESAVGGKSAFLELISDEFPNLPQWIKILITSRPELPLKEKLQHLKPVHVIPHDTNNTADLLKYLQNSLSPICNDDAVLKSLAWKCEGSFLYAYYTQLELKETTKQLTTENISELVPKGIGGFYQKQFQRLRKQLKTINSSEVNLKRFLEVLVAAKGPLPLSLLPDCLGLPDDTEYEVREAIDEVISSILPVYDDCLTVYHKSLRDWLTSDGYKKHAFTVDCQSGNEYLWRACEQVFNQIILLSTFSSFKPCPLTRYALAYGLSHMIQSGCETGYHLSVHVKIVLAMTTIHPHRCREMKDEWCEIVENSLSSLSSDLLQELNWHIRLFEHVHIYHENSSFYLQYVANRINCSDEKRFLARSLLEQGNHFWFEDLDAAEQTNHFCKSVPLRTDVTCIGVSSNEQLVAVGYKDGWVSIFRVPDFQEVHTFDTMPESNVHLSSIFSPDKSMLLYDRYDRHFGMENRDLPFFGGDYGALWSCSFSPSGTRLVTCDGSEKIKLWDVNSENLLARLQAGGPVDGCSFSECGLFIVANKERENDQRVNQRDVFTVWNTLTLQRVDRRNIRSIQRIDGLYSICSIQQRVDRQNGQLLMSRNGNCIDVFQLPDALLAAELYGHFFPYLLPATRYHWHDCVLHRTNESIKLTEVDQLVTMVVQQRCCNIFLRGGLATYFIGCPCSYLKATRVGPVKVQKLYVVPYFNKLNVFSVNQRPMSIQPSFVSEPYIISCCCFSPDGSFLATCANGAPLFVLIWDTKLCTVVQVLPFLMMRAVGCWWSESLLWIYDGGLVKIPISNGQILNPSSARREKINWKPTKLLTFSDVLVFIDQENSANVARIKDGELQYVEKLPVDKSIICAAISPCNSIILAASSETFHVWKEDQTLQPLHWVASNTGELLDILRKKDSEGEDSQPLVRENVCCKCCITSDGTTGLLALSFGEYSPRSCIILVDLNSKIRTLPKVIRCSTQVVNQDVFYAGNSYCIGLNQHGGGDFVAEKLTDGEVVAEWKKSLQFDISSPIVALSKNDLVAIILGNGGIIQFLKIVVPE